MRYEVIDTKGIWYTEKDKTEVRVFRKGSILQDSDIAKITTTKEALEGMIKRERLKCLDGAEEREEEAEGDLVKEEDMKAKKAISPNDKKGKIKDKK